MLLLFTPTGTAVGLTPLAVSPLPKESNRAMSTKDSSASAMEDTDLDALAADTRGRIDVDVDMDEAAGKVVFKLDDDDSADESHPEATEHPGPLVTHRRLQRVYSSDSSASACASPTSSVHSESVPNVLNNIDSTKTATLR